MNKKLGRKLFMTLSVISMIALLSHQKLVYGAATNADALQVVLTALSISKVSDLDFGTAPQGDLAKTVLPAAVDNAENASFNVVGEPLAAYTITLPADGIVKMITAGGGAANKEINVNSFASFPAVAGALGAGGSQLLLVGATRAALLANQTTGNYLGTFTVTVAY